jgi:hypothetical protein
MVWGTTLLGSIPARLTDGQTVENQRRELLAIAARHEWEIAAEFTDRGISGAKSRNSRPGLNRLLKGVARRDFDLVAAWSVDRLGRSLQDLVGLLGELHAKGVDLYLHQQGLDTRTPAGKAMFQGRYLRWRSRPSWRFDAATQQLEHPGMRDRTGKVSARQVRVR